MSHPDPCSLFLAGPTAVGKTEVAILLAERFGAEIISVDSMLVYHGMDIGTAKPSARDRDRIPHHLIDVADFSQPFDVSQFVSLARAAEDDIRARGRRSLYCGGTGLYFKALLEGLGESPATDPVIRAELEQTPPDALLNELARRDPATFASIDRQNLRRVIRAVEVIRVSGRPYSELRARWRDRSGHPGEAPQSAAPRNYRIIGLRRSQADLQNRIDARVDAMFKAGLVAEVQHLLENGLSANRNAMQALGYRQVMEHIQGERGLPETIHLVKRRTRHFAKRQMTWFKNQAAMEWVDMPCPIPGFHAKTGNATSDLSPGQIDSDAAYFAKAIESTETFKSLGWEPRPLR